MPAQLDKLRGPYLCLRYFQLLFFRDDYSQELQSVAFEAFSNLDQLDELFNHRIKYT